jgi:twitching motility protein PilI
LNDNTPSGQDGVWLFRLLHDMERRSWAKGVGLPQQEEQQERWEGVVFNIADTRMVVALDEVAEILNYPPTLTLVPGAQSWMRGLANIRGNLLPIADLQGFLGGTTTITNRRSRVLVYNQGDGLIGLLVGEMVGMRHFDQVNRTGKRDVSGGAGRFVAFGFHQDGMYWPVFSMRALAHSAEFQNAAR